MNYNELFSLRGKTSVVAGGAGLIGREVAKGLAESGSAVLIADSDRIKTGKCIDKLADDGLDVFGVYLDTTKERSVNKLIKFVNRKYGGIDIFVNCAYPRTRDWGKKLERVSLGSWRKNIDMHLSGCFLCSRDIAEHMKRRQGGSIINFASVYGIVGPDFSIYKGTQMTMPAAYSAVKGGVLSFTRYLAAYYGASNVRVNCISPGGVRDRQPAVFVRNYSKKTILGRMADKSDVVGAAIYLASDASKYVTGQNIIVDGGFTAT